jgi:DNA-directed RNA polymerase specialized sigma24 family protein
MGDTDGPIRQADLADGCPALSTLRETYYRPLVRLAALLTGDADTAEAVACDALATLRARSPLGPEPTPDALRYLQHQVLVRSRRSRHWAMAPARSLRGRRPAPRSVPVGPASPQVPAQRDATQFARLPVVRALQDLPQRGREAVVLTHYLDLSEQQAALVAGVAPTALRQTLRDAMRALGDRLSDA